jgi:hypothetical protein
MDFYQLITLQIIAHLLADYFFQTDKWVESKNNSGIKSRFFIMHLVLVFITSWILSFQWLFVVAAFTITLLHTIIDVIKSKLSNNKKVSRYLFFADQILHIGVIIAVTWLHNKIFILNPWFTIPLSHQQIMIAAGFIFITKPSNIIIREIFSLYSIKVPKDGTEPQELPNAGKLIGNMERILTLIFILSARFEAVGFLVAAKSILRFGEKDNLKSEYVLIGTLLSFGIAVLVGILVM